MSNIRRKVWLTRLRGVAQEHRCAAVGTRLLVGAAERTPAVLEPEMELAHVRTTADRLAGTYLVRLFAEFEAALRDHWDATRNTPAPARTRDLVVGTASRRDVPDRVIQDTHAVREQRNAIVHRPTPKQWAVSLDESLRVLERFLARLPPTW